MKSLPHCSEEGKDENEEQTTVEASCKSLEGSPPEWKRVWRALQ